MKILVDLLTVIGAATVVSTIGLVIFMIIDGRRVTRGSNVCGSLWYKVDILNYSFYKTS